MQLPEHTNKIALPGFVFDLEHLELHDSSGARVTMRPRTLAVLNCLARKADHVVTKDELMRAAWPDVVLTDDSLVQCVGELRRALKDDERSVLRTEPRRGYRLVAQGDTGAPPAATTATPVAGCDPFQQHIKFASSADGIRIAYATSGDGPPLVRTAHWMTHLDWDWRSAIYGPFIRRMSMGNCLVRFDGRGCGLSDRSVMPGTLDDELRDLEAVVDAAGLDQFALLGRSGGGATAIRYAAKHPERVRRLVMLGGWVRSPMCRGELSWTDDRVEAFAKVLEEGWGDPSSAVRQIWTSWLFPGATPEQQDSFNQMQRVACTPQQAAALHRRVSYFDASTALEHVRCPTLVLHNPEDAMVPFEEGRLIASTIVGARLEPFSSRNHSPLPGEPAFEQVLSRIEEFLSEPSRSQQLPERLMRSRPDLRVVDNAASENSTVKR